MQVVARLLGPLQRPAHLIAPFVLAHHEDLHRLPVSKLVLLALEQVVVPVQRDGVLVKGCVRAEIDIANLAAPARVPADGDHKLRAVARCLSTPVRFDAKIIADRTALKNVVPGRNHQRGNLDRAEILLDGPLLPVAVVVRMRQPIKKVRCQLLRERRAIRRLHVEHRVLRQRQNCAAHHRVGGSPALAIRTVLGQRRGP